MRVIWSDAAAEDLADIVDRIALDDDNAARRVAKRIFDDLMSLRNMPNRGREREMDTSRELVFAPWPYVALYEVIGDKIFVKGIRHTSRNWPE
jgi:toxin ParE1/3/4